MKANLKLAPALALGLASLMYIVPASAADAITDVPAAPAAPMEEPPLNTWTGPYAGVTLGYSFSGESRDRTAGNSIGTKGFLGGGFAGYNYDVGGVVVGAEADIGYSGVKGSNAGTSVKSGVEGSLRARIGYAVTPDVLVYGTAGGAAKNLKVTEGGASDSNAMLGWTAGVGTDVAITDQVFGRVEYRYSDFGKDTFNTGGGARSVDATDHRIQFGVGMKF